MLEHMHKVLEGLVALFKSCRRCCCDLSLMSLTPSWGVSDISDKSQHFSQHLLKGWSKFKVNFCLNFKN